MPSRLLTEWMAFFNLENEERLKSDLQREAEITEQRMRMKRGKK